MSPLALAVLATVFVESVETTRALELDLRVVEAFESGPVILEFSVTNRGAKTLVIEQLTSSQQCLLALPPQWHAEPRMPRMGCPFVAFHLPLKSGESFSSRFELHRTYRSAFPAGTYDIGVLWGAGTFKQRNSRDALLYDGYRDRHIGYVTKRFPVTIVPATPANRHALAARLEAEFAALPHETNADEKLSSPFQALCDRVLDTPHRELVPLAKRLLARSPARSYTRQKLAMLIFDNDPAAAHRLLVDDLVATPPRLDPWVVSFWWGPRARVSGAWAGFVWSFDPRLWLRPAEWMDWHPWEHLLACLRFAQLASTGELPDAELHRLTGAKDFWVRVYVYRVFGERLGPKWSADFLNEARAWAKTVPEGARAEEDRRAADFLLHGLARYGSKADHALIEVFAAGAEDNPAAQAAREELDRQKEKP